METVLEFKNKEKQRNLEVSEKVALQESWPCVESCKTGRDCDWQGWGGGRKIQDMIGRKEEPFLKKVY